MCAVSVEPQILKTKLYPPRLPEIVTRKRLNSELAKARSCKLAVIVAGAGYGKSTLVAGFLQKLRSPFIWYQLDSTDSDLSVFLSYLIAGLRSIHPEFGGKTLSRLASATNITEQSRAILSILITELDELVAEELFIALDDFHLVNESAQITDAVEFLLEHMLPNLHLIILSRSALSLDLTDLKVRRELLELKEANLRFTHPEIAALFQHIFDMPLSEDDVTALSKSTEGWISGLVLFYLALKDKTKNEVSQAIRETGLSLSDVFDYLSKAAYENQPQAVRDFTTHTSILSRMNPAFCDQLLGINDSKGILSYLIDERLFTIPLDDHGNWYRYHQGLRAFLNKTIIDTLSADVIKGMHLRAAALWEENEEPEEALHHYMEAGDYDKAAEVLEKIATELIQAKRISFLYTEMSRLPEDIRQRHPIIALHYANVASTFGDFSHSLAAIRDASEEFEKMGDKEKQAQSLLTLASLLIVVMRFDEGIEVLSKARDTMPTDSAYYYELRAVEGMVFAHTEHLIDAYQPLEEALSQADGFIETDMVGRLLGWCGVALITLGKLHKSIEVLEVEYNLLQRAGLAATNLINRAESSRVYIWLDRLEEAKRVAEEGIALGEEYGLTPMIFFCRAARAVTWAYQGERDRALEDASIAAAMCLNYEQNALKVYTELYLGEVYGLCGDKEKALKYLKRVEVDWGGFKYLPRLASISFLIQDRGLELAIKEVQDIVDAIRDKGTSINLSCAYSLLFSLKLAAGKEKEARDILETYISEFKEDIILRTYTTDTESLLPFFGNIFMEGDHLELMERVFLLGGKKSIPFLQILEKNGDERVATKARELLDTRFSATIEPLTIRMLGPFKVSRGEQALTAANWKSKKALTILKYLAAHRDKGYVPRDVLMELLWPEALPESAQKNLNSALTSLRKTLEPKAGRDPSSYVLSRADTLSLETGPLGWIDIEVFREKLGLAYQAREVGDFDLYFHALHEATELYDGDFCSEDLYEDWCSQEREVLKNESMRLLMNLSIEYLRRGEFEEALRCLERAAAKDPGREDVYRQQMTICSQAGNRAGIEEAYRRCQRYLADNYDVSPSPETTELYQKLRK